MDFFDEEIFLKIPKNKSSA